MANLIFFVEIKFCSLRVRRVPIYSSWLQHGQNMKFIFLGQMAEVGNITNIFAPCANYFQLNFDKVFNTAWAEYVNSYGLSKAFQVVHFRNALMKRPNFSAG